MSTFPKLANYALRHEVSRRPAVGLILPVSPTRATPFSFGKRMQSYCTDDPVQPAARAGFATSIARPQAFRGRLEPPRDLQLISGAYLA